MFAKRAGIIEKYGSEQTFVSKQESIKKASDDILGMSLKMGTIPGKSGMGMGKTNAYSIAAQFTFDEENMHRMEETRAALKGLGKDIQVVEWQTKEYNDENELVTKNFMKINETIPLNKTNEFGGAIEGTIDGLRENTKGIDSSVSAMKVYDENLLKAGSWTDRFTARGKDLKKMSWDFTMLSLGALGVYFSMLGITNTLKWGIQTLVGPLGDLGEMIKNYAMSQAFGTGQGGDMSTMIEGWKKITGLTADWATILATTAADILSDPVVWAAIDSSIKTIAAFFTDPENKEKIKDIFVGIAGAVKAIADSAGPFLSVIAAVSTPIKEWPVIGNKEGNGPASNLPLGLGNQSALSLGIQASMYAMVAMVVGSIISMSLSLLGRGAMLVGGAGSNLGKAGAKIAGAGDAIWPGGWKAGIKDWWARSGKTRVPGEPATQEIADILANLGKEAPVKPPGATPKAPTGGTPPVPGATSTLDDLTREIVESVDLFAPSKYAGKLSISQILESFSKGGMTREEAITALIQKGANPEVAANAIGKLGGTTKFGGSMLFMPGDLESQQTQALKIRLSHPDWSEEKIQSEAAGYMSSQWGMLENPLEYAKQRWGYWPNMFGANVQAETRKPGTSMFMGMDTSGWFGGGQQTTPSQEQVDALATAIAKETPVMQNITVTYIIQGDFDKETATASENLLIELLKQYAKGTTIGGLP